MCQADCKMIDCKQFGGYLYLLGIDTVVGVPDSTLKGIINFFSVSEEIRQVTAANECEAAGIAMGSYMASGKPALCYLQNSGLGKIVNPYTSLIAKEIYSIPLLLLIGWRGRPGEKDEPQHIMMGRIMTDLLDCLEIPQTVLQADEWEHQLSDAYHHCMQYLTPYALIVPKGLFKEYVCPREDATTGITLARETALESIVNIVDPKSLIVCTTGKSSRELFEIRERMEDMHGKDIYTVGGMGCASSIALGMALKQPERRVVCIDGDGAVLMQLGTMATIGHYKPKNLLHILIDNQSYESTGRQPTVSKTMEFAQVADGCGYSSVKTVDTVKTLATALKDSMEEERLCLIIVKCTASSRSDLGRPTTMPVQNKEDFMKFAGAVHGG